LPKDGLSWVPRNAADRERLAKDHFVKLAQDAVEGNQLLLQTNPQDAEAQLRLGSAFGQATQDSSTRIAKIA